MENLVRGDDLQDAVCNDIASLGYQKLPRVLGLGSGAGGVRIATEEEWAQALDSAAAVEADDKLVLIEVMLDKTDVSDAYRGFMSHTAGTR